jgi:elongation factor Ts
MPDFTTADIKRLRDLTGAGMMACKKALTEASGDIEKAIIILRESGAAKAIDRAAERDASDGIVVADGGAMLELNCETDFVAKNETFQKLAADLLVIVRDTKPADVAALVASDFGGKTVEQAIAETSAIIGEKIAVGRIVTFDGATATYLHRRSADLPPQMGVVVEYTGPSADAARNAAMQAAAMRPAYLTRDEVPADIVATEREVAEALARKDGKPEQTISRIVDGRLNAFYKDNVLTEQPSVQDNKKTVKALLDEAGVTLTRFARFEVGNA